MRRDGPFFLATGQLIGISSNTFQPDITNLFRPKQSASSPEFTKEWRKDGAISPPNAKKSRPHPETAFLKIDARRKFPPNSGSILSLRLVPEQ